MCRECGCGLVGEVNIGGVPGSQIPSPLETPVNEGLPPDQPGAHPQAGPIVQGHDHGHAHEPQPDHGHSHHHPHTHEHEHEHTHGPGSHTVTIQESILAKNDRLAERNRGYFKAKGLLVLNVVSAPGSGKTTLIQQTALRLGSRLRTGVIVGDLATDQDANRLRSARVPVVQINTGTVCHLEAGMVAKAMTQIPLESLQLLVIENVGNLVCPAAYDLGENLRVVLLSATEGEDKPLKYPPMFHSADVALITKVDLAQAADFNRDQALANLRQISHHATIFEVASKTGQGMDAWCDFLVAKYQALH